MLTHLTIENIVLIDRLDLDLKSGLTTLTGETGAGKSILLSALNFILGGRCQTEQIRHGTDYAAVSAVFETLPADHPALQFLKDQDISHDDTIIIRRKLSQNGRGKCFVNDQNVGVQFLKTLGKHLIENHGQFETMDLLNPKTHIKTLDNFGGLSKKVAELQSDFKNWNHAKDDLTAAHAQAKTAKEREDYLRYVVKELSELDPKLGEEDALSTQRQKIMHQEKVITALQTIEGLVSNDGSGLYGQASSALSALDKIPEEIEGSAIKNLRASLNSALIEIQDAESYIQDAVTQTESTSNIDSIEERYFALKDCAQKHNCSVDDLVQKTEGLKRELALIDDLEGQLNALETRVIETRKIYYAAAEKLSALRLKSATKLTESVTSELPDLKLDKAKFIVKHTQITEENQWTARGIDHISFEVSTNPGTPAGAIHKVASGGELARFMLSLKLALAGSTQIPTLVFDEVDSGVGGATADAVGTRLKRLSLNHQIIVVTHSAQVAAKGNQHYRIEKSTKGNITTTQIKPLEQLDRLDEIARMISGAEITSEAKAVAAHLLENKAA